MQLGERKWTDVPELTQKVVVVPTAAFEQHGHHMPLLTDTLIGSEIARRAEAELGDAALFTPTLWVGASDHHRGFPGTISLGNALYVRVLVDIMESLIGGGFRKIFLLNSHGGNITPGRMALYDVQLRHRDKPDLWLAMSSWWMIAEEQIRALPDLQTFLNHACELETSMILSLRPELVKPEAARGACFDFDSAFYVPDFSRGSRVDVARAFDQVSATGAFGRPELATADKGERLFATATREVVAFVREFAAWETFSPQ